MLAQPASAMMAAALVGGRVEVVRRVVRVQGLEKQRDVVRRRLGRGGPEIADEDCTRRGPLGRRDHARHAVQRRAAGRPQIGERLVDARLEFVLPAREGAKAIFARRDIAPDGVDAEQRQGVGVQPGAHALGWHIIGPVQFDSPEAGFRGRIDPFEQRPIGPQKSEIG